jgi:DNA repair protein RecO (recombination protein O)
MQEKVKGIILKTMDYKEKDKLMWVFTEEFGKISVLCKGVRSQKSRFQSLVRPLLFGEFLLYKGKSLYSLNEGNIINSFSHLSTSLEMLTYGSYYVELVDIVSIDHEPQGMLYRNLVTALYLLESGALDMEVLTLAYEVKLIHGTGLTLSREMVPFEISQGALKTGDFLQKTDFSRIHVLKIDERTKKELQSITAYILKDSYQRRPKSLDMLKYM